MSTIILPSEKRQAVIKKKIRMLKTALGSDNGFHVHKYKEGDAYEVCEALANNFIGSGHAEDAGMFSSAKQPPSNKALSDSDYKNKSDKHGS